VISGYAPGKKLVIPIHNKDDPEADLAAWFDWRWVKFLIEHLFDVEHEPISEWLAASAGWEVEQVD
jgi:hypothetical protein